MLYQALSVPLTNSSNVVGEDAESELSAATGVPLVGMGMLRNLI
jgi:hypothetical protein